LTFCGTGDTGYYDVAGLTAAGAADAVFIMGYDFRTGSSSHAGSIDPLTSPKPVYDLTGVVNAWKKRTSASTGSVRGKGEGLNRNRCVSSPEAASSYGRM